MIEDKKKFLMIGIIAVLLAISAIVFFFSKDKNYGIDSIGKDENLLVKCSNPDCKTDYQISKRDYFEFLQENMSPLSARVPPLECEKCGKKSVYRAVHCENCEKLFFHGEVQNDFKDRCPYCKFSLTEQERRND